MNAKNRNGAVMQVGWRLMIDLMCVLAAGALVYRVLDASPWLDEQSRRLEATQIGEAIALRQASWSDAERHVVLVLSTTCPACQTSVPFYRRLAAAAASTSDGRFLVMSAQPEAEVEAWLETNGIHADEIVRERNLLQFGLGMTPSLLLVDRAGTVSGAMVGVLSAPEELQVMGYLTESGGEPAPDNMNRVEVISSREVPAFRERVRPVVVDIRERFIVELYGLDDRVNTPAAEFAVRAPIELSRRDPILLDCSVAQVAQCRVATEVLGNNGFMNVTLIGE